MVCAPHVTPGFYRRPWAREWNPVEIVAAYPGERFLCREVGRPLPGVFMASRSDLRVDAGVSFRVMP